MFKFNFTTKILLISSVVVFLLSGCGSGSEETTKTVAVNTEEETLGGATYKQYCKVCHAQALNGAPILGNKVMWSSRLAKGEGQLIQSAFNGFGLMPANLGREGLDEEKITEAVKYMISAVE